MVISLLLKLLKCSEMSSEQETKGLARSDMFAFFLLIKESCVSVFALVTEALSSKEPSCLVFAPFLQLWLRCSTPALFLERENMRAQTHSTEAPH